MVNSGYKFINRQRSRRTDYVGLAQARSNFLNKMRQTENSNLQSDLILGASLSEPHLVTTTAALSIYLFIYIK